jgi:hypothetical protein
MNDKTDKFDRLLIERSHEGDAEAGREFLRQVVSAITAGRFDSPVFDALAKRLSLFLDGGIPLERALGVESEKDKGGTPATYDPIELAAVDLLLREHANFTKEAAIRWIEDKLGADRSTVMRCRKMCDSRYNNAPCPLMEVLGHDDLLHLSGSLYRYIKRLPTVA